MWHQRLLRPGEVCMREIHKHIDGTDGPLRCDSFYCCVACMQGKPRKGNRNPSERKKHKRKITKNKIKDTQHLPSNSPTDDTDDIHIKMQHMANSFI